MFNNLGLHIVQFPTGRFGFRGNVPRALGNEEPATAEDVMANRVYYRNGEAYVTRFPTFSTYDEAITYAINHGYIPEVEKSKLDVTDNSTLTVEDQHNLILFFKAAYGG